MKTKFQNKIVLYMFFSPSSSMFLQLAICIQTENLSCFNTDICSYWLSIYKQEIVASKETRLRVLKPCKIDLENVSTLELAKTYTVDYNTWKFV